MQVSLAALLAASVAAAGTKCAVHQECGHCLDATDDDNNSCFCAPHRALERMGPLQPLTRKKRASLAGCYSTRSCQAVKIDKTSIIALLERKTFNGCVDYGLDRATCTCRPTVYTSCADCATAEHPSCVWMPNGTMTMTTTIQLASGGAVHSKSWAAPMGGRCMVGMGYGPRVRVGVRLRDRARVRAGERAGAGAGVRFSDPSLLLTAAVALTRWARASGRRE